MSIFEGVESVVDATEQIRSLGTKPFMGYQGRLNELQLYPQLTDQHMSENEMDADAEPSEVSGRAA